MANMWMVRAGENAFLIDDFKELNIVVIGWKLSDLSNKSPNEIKELMKEKYPQANKASLNIYSAQVTRFVYEFDIGDYVISYNPQTHMYLIGKITSSSNYNII